MKEINGSISILSRSGDDGDIIEITITCEKSREDFVVVTLTPDQFVTAAMGRLCHADVEKMEIRGLEKVDKEIEVGTHHLHICDNEEKNYIRLDKLQEMALSKIDEECPEGWEASKYLGSQNSIYQAEDGSYWARFTIRRWK